MRACVREMTHNTAKSDLQVQQWPALRGLVLVTKEWLQQSGLGDLRTGGLSGYALSLMAVVYLQVMPGISHSILFWFCRMDLSGFQV